MSPRKKVLVYGMLVLAAAPVVVGVFWKSGVERQWRELLQRVDEVERTVDARLDDDRPVLHGEPRDGSALEHYERAVALAAEWNKTSRLRGTFEEVAAASGFALAERRTRVAAAGPALEALRDGAHARDTRLFSDWRGEEVDWQTDVEYPAIAPMQAGLLSELAFQAAATHVAHGDVEEGCAILLDALQFARDLAATPTLVESRAGCLLLVRSDLLAFGEQGGWSRLSRPQIERWVHALHTVEASLPLPGDADLAHTVRTVRSLAGYLSPHDEPPLLERLAFPWAVAGVEYLVLDGFRLRFDLHTDLQAALDHGAPMQPILDRYESLAEGNDGLSGLAVRTTGEALDARIRALDRLRALRHALALLADLPAEAAEGTAAHALRSETTDAWFEVTAGEERVRLPRTATTAAPR